MYSNRTEVFVDMVAWTQSLNLYVRKSADGSGKGVWLTSPTEVEVNSLEGEKAPVALSLELIEAQALMDQLWKAGLRPTEGSGSAGALAATQNHLADMQRIVFDGGGRWLRNYLHRCVSSSE